MVVTGNRPLTAAVTSVTGTGRPVSPRPHSEFVECLYAQSPAGQVPPGRPMERNSTLIVAHAFQVANLLKLEVAIRLCRLAVCEESPPGGIPPTVPMKSRVPQRGQIMKRPSASIAKPSRRQLAVGTAAWQRGRLAVRSVQERNLPR